MQKQQLIQKSKILVLNKINPVNSKIKYKEGKKNRSGIKQNVSNKVTIK